jgi:protein required for attachment to host cells
MTKETIWVVAADGRSARIFEGGRIGALTEIETLVEMEAGLPERDLTTDAPGRATATGGRRQAFEARNSKRETARERLASTVVEHLSAGRSQNRFERLYVVAEPTMLGLLRDEIAREPAIEVTLDLPLDVIQDSAAKLRARLPDRL